MLHPVVMDLGGPIAIFSSTMYPASSITASRSRSTWEERAVALQQVVGTPCRRPRGSLVSMVSMDLPELQARIREHLALRTDVRVAVLFGSRARGTARPDSDVDLAVEAPGGDLLTLGAELVTALDLEVDVVDLADATIPLLEHLIRDGIVVHEARRGAGGLWRSRTLATLETDRPWYQRMRDAWLARVAREGL
jgi:predicted nucleotidyltransferase